MRSTRGPAASGVLKTTPFHPRTAALNRAWAWRRWAGYVVASAYEPTHDREYAAIRSAAALLDVTPLFKYRIRGPDAARLLDRVVTRDVSRCAVGQVLYTPWCDSRGKVLDDGTLARLGEEEFRLHSTDPELRWLEENAPGFDVRVEDVSEAIATLALQGPTSRAILERVAEADVGALRFFRLTAGAIRGRPVEISRTGYTGDLGYEIWTAAEHALPVWDALMEAGRGHGITPAGLLALDVARNEAGFLLLGVDYVPARRALIDRQMSSPYELGLGWAVKLEKAAFVGRAALEAEREREPAWGFAGVEVEWESLERLYAEVGLPPALPTVAWRGSVPLYADGEQVGYATSGCWSPLLKKSIAQAHLRSPWHEPGRTVELEVTVEHRHRRARATVVRRPFFDPERKKA